LGAGVRTDVERGKKYPLIQPDHSLAVVAQNRAARQF
jgi:hypothetical protein